MVSGTTAHMLPVPAALLTDIRALWLPREVSPGSPCLQLSHIGTHTHIEMETGLLVDPKLYFLPWAPNASSLHNCTQASPSHCAQMGTCDRWSLLHPDQPEKGTGKAIGALRHPCPHVHAE